jgi:hypothetical protein
MLHNGAALTTAGAVQEILTSDYVDRCGWVNTHVVANGLVKLVW